MFLLLLAMRFASASFHVLSHTIASRDSQGKNSAASPSIPNSCLPARKLFAAFLTNQLQLSLQLRLCQHFYYKLLLSGIYKSAVKIPFALNSCIDEKTPGAQLKKKINICVLDFNTFQEKKMSLLLQTVSHQTET